MSKEIEESKIVSRLNRQHDLLQDMLDGQSGFMRKTDLCMYKLESLCYRLKCAIIDHSLKLPSLVSFRYYLDGIASESELSVVVEMLHDCWMYAFPNNLFDKAIKSESSLDDVLKTNVKDFDENDNLNPLHLEYAKKFVSDGKESQSRTYDDYRLYFDKLNYIVSDRCLKSGLRIDERFMLTRFMLTDLSMAALKDIYQYLVSQKDIESNKEDIFLAIFSASVIALSQKLRWTRRTKSGFTNYSCLFILMRTLASDKVDDNEVKSVITSVFCEGDGTTIDVSKLKKRGESADQQLFDRDIRGIIANHAPKTERGVHWGEAPSRYKNK